jgi:hypothetical protein
MLTWGMQIPGSPKRNTRSRSLGTIFCNIFDLDSDDQGPHTVELGVSILVFSKPYFSKIYGDVIVIIASVNTTTMMNQGPDAMTAAAVIAVLMVPHPALWLITQPLTQTLDPITASSYSDVAAYQHQRYLQIFQVLTELMQLHYV